ncbi:HAD family hydrolase [Streptomyces sp. TRM 70351]|uniref:HAD family hydrolase n=1 Tax=Streptomyces sp. TRM 70351 TaxID=3116552 RepID=UPI002E7BDDA3|nr:HAD family hydrolase [Streptomyces sp. TRM 70351]MEE1927308.1 HAD family hydrolase [Streptomyces sp. TRM 70351]
MPVRAILWDVDDTLFDYTGSDRAAALRHLREEGLLDAFDTPEAAWERWRAVMEEQFARFLAGELDFHEHRRGRARDFLGRPLTDAEADAWFGRYVAHYEAAWCLFPDALPALDALRDGYRHGVLSNSSAANQDRKLRALGIRDRFEVLVCADELGCAKPAPEAFTAACAALGLPPKEVAYVGDRLDIDALAAQAAGLTGIWLDRSCSGTSEAVACITGLGDLQALLTSP